MENHTFESELELVRYTVKVNDGTGRSFLVSSLEDGIAQVKNHLEIGVMSCVIVERAYFSKWVYAMSQDGEWMHKYGLIWKRVN